MKRWIPIDRALRVLTLAALVATQAQPAAAGQSGPPVEEPAPRSAPSMPAPTGSQGAGRADRALTHAGRLGIRALVDEALSANPELAAMRREFDAARARVPQAKALPDPMLMFGNMTQGNPIPFAGLTGDFSEIYAGASQRLPWFGVRRLRGLVASSEAESKFQEYFAKVRQIAAEVKGAAFDIFALDRRVAVAVRGLEILERLAEVAGARYEVGKAEQVDVINARLEITELLHVKGELEAERASAAARLNALLLRAPDAEIGAVAIERSGLGVPPYEMLVQLASENAPEIKQQRRLIDARNHALRLAEREAKYPQVDLTFVYHNRPAFPDYYEYGVTLELPLWAFNKQRYGVEEKTSDLAAARARLRSTESLVNYRLRDAYVRATNAARLVRLHEQGLVPQSVLALESAMASYQVGKVDFGTLLTALKKALDYESQYYELLAEYSKALAEIEAYVGVELVR